MSESSEKTINQMLIKQAAQEANQHNMAQDIKEIKSDVKCILGKFEELPEKFITRREGRVLQGAIILLVAMVTAVATIVYTVKTK